jgi:acetate kinase
MGPRSGDIDPAIPFYLARTLGKPFDEIETILNKQSGLKGISGANDMREIERLAAGGNMNAKLAIDMFCYRIKKYIGAYYAVLGTVDAIIFTGGIGENAVETREQICSGLEALGIVMDAAKNSAPSRAMREVSADTSRVKIMVIPTNEELEIAEQTVECIKGA